MFCVTEIILFYRILYGEQAKYYEAEQVPLLKHIKPGLLSMVNVWLKHAIIPANCLHFCQHLNSIDSTTILD